MITNRALPRASGGISHITQVTLTPSASSPRERGYFPVCNSRPAPRNLFPARAGVFLADRSASKPGTTLPRASGGISGRAYGLRGIHYSSPRERGYFRRILIHPQADLLFSARAGVFPHEVLPAIRTTALPRASGGISKHSPDSATAATSSPRERGYFQALTRLSNRGYLFPARAGVFPFKQMVTNLQRALPRASGGISASWSTPVGEPTLPGRAGKSTHTYSGGNEHAIPHTFQHLATCNGRMSWKILLSYPNRDSREETIHYGFA